MFVCFYQPPPRHCIYIYFICLIFVREELRLHIGVAVTVCLLQQHLCAVPLVVTSILFSNSVLYIMYIWTKINALCLYGSILLFFFHSSSGAPQK